MINATQRSSTRPHVQLLVGPSIMNALTFALIFVSVSLNSLAQVILRKAMLTLGALPTLDEPVAFALVFIKNFYLWGGLVCYAVSICMWLAVLANTQVSVAYPMLSIGYVIAAALSFVFLGEPIGAARFGGILLICAGVVLVARSA